MSGQPLGGSGIDLDIITGQPKRPRTQEEHRAAEELKDKKVLQESIAISQELPVVLPIVARQLESRLIELMKADPMCLSFLQIINAFKVKVDVSRHVASKIRRQAMGIALTNMTDETKVAPEEGIPTEE